MSTITDINDFPIVDIASYLDKSSDSWKEGCKTIAELLHNYGILIIKDPRVDENENDIFIDMIEQYFEQPDEVKAADIRKEQFYQVGVTPSGIEKARDHCSRASQLEGDDKPATICPPETDPKCRFFWRIGERPEKTEFNQLNAEAVIPKAFEDRWTNTMNKWGGLILETVKTVSEMAAIGYDLETDAFTKLMNYGPHLLAPTGSDLNKWSNKGTVFASYHYDLNFITIHGRSRFPGLFIWTRDGKKLQVKVPPKCLLLQAGKQFEWLTGGHVLAGFHEVVVVDDTIKAMEKAKEAGRSLWRISSTLFSHIASDNVLEPLGRFDSEENRAKYPPTKAGNQVRAELDAIKLGDPTKFVAAM